MKYLATIGLEIHAELKTKSKMFCSCPNAPDEKHPNIHICPTCLGHPGTLPVINKEAVLSVLKVGLALNCKINNQAKFDRKNYFYPDLPKGYQISQYDQPLCSYGQLGLYLSPDPEINKKKIDIIRIHLEEDTARLIHPDDKKSTLIDYNRAGRPLMELVTEPDIHSAQEAKLFAQGLQLLLRYLDVSEADMEKGQMRVEANVSVGEAPDNYDSSKIETKYLGIKVEVKNLNSFKAVEKAIEYEIERQIEVLKRGEKVVQETRGWDDNKGITYSQRSKEEAHDYRYFPEPDLPPLIITSHQPEIPSFIDLEDLKKQLPILPWEAKESLIKNYGLEENQAILLINEPEFNNFFLKTIKIGESKIISDLQEKFINLAYNYLTSDLKGLMADNNLNFSDLKIIPEHFADLIVLLIKGDLASRGAKNILEEMIKTGKEPKILMQELGLTKISDQNALIKIIQEVIETNPGPVNDFKNGKTNALQFLIGQCMAKTKGAADPSTLKEMIEKELQ